MVPQRGNASKLLPALEYMMTRRAGYLSTRCGQVQDRARRRLRLERLHIDDETIARIEATMAVHDAPAVAG
jgi:hypothetical protein